MTPRGRQFEGNSPFLYESPQIASQESLTKGQPQVLSPALDMQPQQDVTTAVSCIQLKMPDSKRVRSRFKRKQFLLKFVLINSNVQNGGVVLTLKESNELKSYKVMVIEGRRNEVFMKFRDRIFPHDLRRTLEDLLRYMIVSGELSSPSHYHPRDSPTANSSTTPIPIAILPIAEKPESRISKEEEEERERLAKDISSMIVGTLHGIDKVREFGQYISRLSNSILEFSRGMTRICDEFKEKMCNPGIETTTEMEKRR